MQESTKITQRAAKTASGDAVSILAFSGDISSTSKDAMLAAYHGLGLTAASLLLLDFTGVEYINSSGIAIIIQMLIEAHKVGSRALGIFGPSPHFRKVFAMVGINKYANLYDEERAALA
jgi:anti-anti-sigma factor